MLVMLGMAGCASGPSGSTSVSADPVDPTASPSGSPAPVPSGSPTPSPTGPTLIQFSLSMNPEGVFDSTNGYYIICFNSFDTPIDVSNTETFTDFIEYDGTSAIWWHRQTLSSSNQFFYLPASPVNQDVSFSGDRHTMNITFSIHDQTNPLNTFIATNQFTADAVTTDRNGIIGAVIDTMGPNFSGESSLDNDTLYSYFCDKTLGVVNPAPPNYPDDPQNDWITQNGNSSFPYINFDIASFTVTVH